MDVASNFVTHHMGFRGYAFGGCWTCHSTHPNDPSWDPADPENIRYCEICHDIKTLHTIEAHTGLPDEDGGHAAYGWAAVGFHASDPSETPSEYRSFDATEQCRGCHGDNPPARSPGVLTEQLPHIGSMSSTAGSCGDFILLTGNHFGSQHTLGRGVQLKSVDDQNALWVNVPVRRWSDTGDIIEWGLPCWTFSPGNYSVRVYTEFGGSNELVFTVLDQPTFINASPDSGTCGTYISLSGSGGFGAQQSEVYEDGYHGVVHVIDFVSPTGRYTAKRYENWSDTSLDVRIRNMFIDENDVCTGQRNFVQDDATPVPCIVDGFPGSSPCDNNCAAYRCPDEPNITGCQSMDIGTYSVHVRAIYFGDEDRTGDLSCGDTIFHVATSDAISFELEPYIYEAVPKEIERGNVLKISGKGFGTEQAGGGVRIGSKTMANAADLNEGWVLTRIETWSNTRIEVWLEVPPTWENRTKYVWIEKDGKKSNFQWITILEPDGDGVIGDADNCPNTPNVDQSDTDGDGLGDACDCWEDPENDPDGDGVCGDVDNCPATPNPKQGDADGDGQGNLCDVCPYDPANDADGDGLCADADNCPAISNEDQADADGDGQGDLCDDCPNDPGNDADGDGVCSDVDNCPEAFNTGQRDSDKDGMGNKCDPCPYDPANDADGDGLCADADNCPAISNEDQADSNGNGIGDACEPIADAGPDVEIVSGDQAITVIQGAVSDPNGDPLTFRWLEGATELSGWQDAGQGGEAYLTIAGFSLGNHTLTLEVNDGEFTVSDDMVVRVFPNPEIQLIQASITGGFGANGIHFYIGDMVTFGIDYQITGGIPGAQYEVTGVAVPQYPFCTNTQRRATAVDHVGSGVVHTISFQKRVPACADDPYSDPDWTVVKWRVDLKTDDGSILRDRDRLDTDDALAIDRL
jgi:hypothetical protein